MKKQAISLLLLAAMLSVAACAEKTDDPVSSGDTSVNSVSESESESETRIEPVLPDERYDGYTFRVLTKGQVSGSHWQSIDIAAEEENAEPINDAVYRRNTKIFDRFGVSIVDIPSPDGTWNLTTSLRKAISSNIDEYDMVAGSLIEIVAKMSQEGNLIDLHTVPYMDLEKPWYDQNCIEQTSLGGKLFGVTGDMILMDNNATWAVLFNKKMADTYQMGDLYERVNSNTWTLDYMTECAKLATSDLNSNGKMEKDDQWGCVGEKDDTYFYMLGCGVTAAVKDDEGTPVLTVDSERFFDAFNKAVLLNCDDQITMNSNKFSWTDIDASFTEGRILFYMGGLVRVTLFRSMETDFGILPLPKYDEEQTNYYSPISLYSTNSIEIPVTASNLERTGAIIEALSAESYYSLTSAYYETVLKTKGARDLESGDMLDVIFASRIYDLAYMYNWGDIVGSIGGLKIGGNISSTMARNLKGANRQIEKTLDAYSKLG